MTLSNLAANYAYLDRGPTDIPIVVVMHEFSPTVNAGYGTNEVLYRMANYGVFAVSPGMRGRDSASGTPDCSARELWDIIDCVEQIRATYAGVVSPTHVALAGYSGGGGNAMAVAAKFPDYFNSVISFHGIVDYGDDPTYGWYPSASGAQQTLLRAWIGNTPTIVPDAYKARNHLTAIVQNYTAGHLWLYHDAGDATVQSFHSTRLRDAMLAAGRTNYEANISQSGDPVRWIHGSPIIGNNGENDILAEPNWLAAVAAKTYAPWTVPTSGTVEVRGYIKTKRFEIWLGTTSQHGAGGGLNEIATVVYDTAAHTYTVTPSTGPTDVYVKEGARVGTASGISTATLITAT